MEWNRLSGTVKSYRRRDRANKRREEDMADIITINPITRISGFLEIRIELEQNTVKNAWSSGILFRGFEKMLRGRPPLDAVYFTERICGICSTAHATASTLALENILGIRSQENDQMLRDYIHASEFLQNHIRHFYQYTLPDYVQAPGLLERPQGMAGDYRIPESVSLELAAHYTDSIRYSRLAHEMLAVLGGKAPHNHGITAGGITCFPGPDKLIKLQSILQMIKEFVENIMIPDVETIASYYPDYFNNGRGYGNLMTYGIFNTYTEPELFYVNPKVMIGGGTEDLNPDYITENIHYAWYQASKEVQKPTEPTVEEDIYKEEAYSFIKAPRYEGFPIEVGPLARMYLSGEYNRGISTMDRTIARVLEVRKVIGIMEGLLERIEPKQTVIEHYVFANEARGQGLIDTTRGALGHWVAVNNQEITNYEIITPSVWNLSTEDPSGLKGTIEYALIGTEVKDSANPVEIGRIVRSYDPCVSCATHIFSDRYAPVHIQIV